MSHRWLSPRQDAAAAPIIRTIGLSDLHEALRLGWEDFKAVPSHAIILCVIYPVLGLVLARTVLGYSVLPLLFPLAAGFALLGPFAALGLYELSRRRERGEQASAWDALEVLRSPSFGAMLGLGTLLLALFVIWVATAQAIYVAAFGYEAAAEIPDFARRVLTTPQGWWLIVVGCGVGFLFALVALCISVVSFPLMLDRHAGAGEAMVTSLRAVARNPVADGGMGIDRRGAAGGGIAAVLPRSCRRHPAARPRHLASLSRGDRAGSQSAADPSAPAARTAPGGGFPGQPVSVAAQGRRIAVDNRARIEPPVECRPAVSRGGHRTIGGSASAGRRSLIALFWPRLPRHSSRRRIFNAKSTSDAISAMTLRSLFRASALGAVADDAGGASRWPRPAAPAISDAGSTISRPRPPRRAFRRPTIASGLNGVTLDQERAFPRSLAEGLQPEFEEFSGRMVPPRLTRGANMMKQYGSVLVAHRADLWRARRGAGGDLGAGDRFRRQHRKVSDHAFAGDAGL